jgi:histidyl-tRNA synthetase
MLAALEELGGTAKATTPAPVLVTMLDAAGIPAYLQMGRNLRRAGIGAEVYPEAKNIGRQMKYADKRGFRFCLIAGADEFAAGTWQIRDLQQGAQVSVATAEVAGYLVQALTPAAASGT